MSRLYSLFLYSEVSNLFVALGLGYLAQRLLNQEVNPFLLAFISFSAFFFYSLERNLTLPSVESSIFPGKTKWIADHQRLNRVLIFLAGALSSLLFISLREISQLCLLGFFFLALGYSLWPIAWRGQALKLKEVPWLKPILLTSCWVALTLWLPMIEGGQALNEKALFITVVWLAWIFANSVFFDIRDLELDAAAGNRTLAMRLGKERAHQVIQWTLFLQMCLAWAWLEQGHQPWFWALTVGSLTFLGLNYRFSRQTNLGLPFFVAADLTLVLPSLALTLWL